ncbi:MAG: hypothetical protein ACTHZU_07665, partial [Lacticaseibacillus paracasei]
TRSRTHKPMCTDLKRIGPSAAIAIDAAYTPVSNRVSSRSFFYHCSKVDHFREIWFYQRHSLLSKGQ